MASQNPLGLRSGRSRISAEEGHSVISRILDEIIHCVVSRRCHRSFINEVDRLDLIDVGGINAWIEFSEDVFRVEFERDVIRALFRQDVTVVAVDVKLERIFERTVDVHEDARF